MVLLRSDLQYPNNPPARFTRRIASCPDFSRQNPQASPRRAPRAGWARLGNAQARPSPGMKKWMWTQSRQCNENGSGGACRQPGNVMKKDTVSTGLGISSPPTWKRYYFTAPRNLYRGDAQNWVSGMLRTSPASRRAAVGTQKLQL